MGDPENDFNPFDYVQRSDLSPEQMIDPFNVDNVAQSEQDSLAAEQQREGLAFANGYVDGLSGKDPNAAPPAYEQEYDQGWAQGRIQDFVDSLTGAKPSPDTGKPDAGSGPSSPAPVLPDDSQVPT
jgi:hypothetical protein